MNDFRFMLRIPQGELGILHGWVALKHASGEIHMLMPVEKPKDPADDLLKRMLLRVVA